MEEQGLMEKKMNAIQKGPVIALKSRMSELHGHASLRGFLHISSSRTIRRQMGNISVLLRDMNYLVEAW